MTTKKGKGKVDAPTGPFSALKALRDQLAAKDDAKDGPSRIVAARATTPAKPSPATANTSSLSGDDALAFHRLMSGVTPLGTKGAHRVRRGAGDDARPLHQRAQAVAAAAAEEVHEHLRALVEGGTRFEVTDDGRRVEGRRTDVPTEWVRKLRHGLFPIDAQLDLHGHHATAARSALGIFLAEKRQRGERCVLVIHGRGTHSGAGQPILRGEMAAWLSQGPSSIHVAAFTTARSEDGGEGAVYVLLRRGPA